MPGFDRSRWTYVQDPFELNGCWIRRRMRGAPDTIQGAHSSIKTTGVGTRSRTKQTKTTAAQAQASRVSWPEKQDKSLQITHMARDLRATGSTRGQIHETYRGHFPTYKIDENQNVKSGLQRLESTVISANIYFIPPPRAGGGAVGASTPVSTVPLGLIHHIDPLLVTQLREDPASLAVRDTRVRVLSTMRLVRTGLGRPARGFTAMGGSYALTRGTVM